jgi:hypothetical protein
MNDLSLFWLGTYISIKSGDVKLILSAQSLSYFICAIVDDIWWTHGCARNASTGMAIIWIWILHFQYTFSSETCKLPRTYFLLCHLLKTKTPLAISTHPITIWQLLSRKQGRTLCTVIRCHYQAMLYLTNNEITSHIQRL